jgi:pyruvate/2-oxoglutarate dehydrogenase complex dihydrolipoamide dehydrogenase (E3) component
MSATRTGYDVAVVGGGSAGYAAARTVAAAGLRTVVVEGGEEVGGLCILRGCMPTKALLYAAEVMHLAGQAGTWGVQTGPITCNLHQVMARKNALVREFADYRTQQLASSQFEFVRARARFLDAQTLQLSNGPTLAAQQIVIATGSVVADPPLAQLKEVGYLDSDRVLRLTQLPKSILVLGGGAVAVEYAQFFARVGAQVTLIQRSGHVLKEFDTDAALALEAAFRREGITVYTGTRLESAWRKGAKKGITFEHQGEPVQVMAEEIFFALGRKPLTAPLDLDRAGVARDGVRVVTNPCMRTNVPNIYAAGDCTSPHEIVHVAIQQGEVAGHNIAFPARPRAIDNRLLMEVVFTDPQVALVGLTERRAREGNQSYQAASHPFSDHGKSMIMNVRDGFVKLLADPGTGEILGGCCVGPAGGELIHEIMAVMAKRMTVHELAALPHYHPTLAEIWTYPAEELAARIKG